MKLLVCISIVPDTTAKITFSSDNTQLNTAGVQYILNPNDEIALSKAVELAGNGKGSVTVINVGEASNEPTIRKALAIGADEAVRVNADPSEAYFVAHQIAAYSKDKSFDIIFTGQESIDYNGSSIGAMVAELNNLPSISNVKKLDITGNIATIERQIEGGKEVLEVETPFVISCIEGLAESKIPNMRGIMSARTKPLLVVEALNVEPVTKIVKYQTPSPRGKVRILSAGETATLVELLHTEAKVI
jgi:electron transfer flavoprotein beta subunit